MSYNYQTERPKLFTEQNTQVILKIRDKIAKLFKEAGAFKSSHVMGLAGDSWTALAILDYLVELGEIHELTNPYDCCGQDQVYVEVRRTA